MRFAYLSRKNCQEQFLTSRSDGPQGGRHGWQAIKLSQLQPIMPCTSRIAPMTLAPRQHDILNLARERGYVSIDELAQAFAVTPQTIRRDINHLAGQGLLRRTHGGAASEASGGQNTGYAMRPWELREGCQRIAEAIAAHIPDHASLFINIGTTTEAIARELLKRKGLKIITNNLHVAAQLSA